MALLDDIVEEAIRRKQLEAFNQALQEPSSVADRFVFGDPQLEAMEPTTQMQIGEKLQDYLGGLRKTFPEANPYGTAIEDFLLGGSEDLAREMTEGYKAVDFNNFMDANRPIIDPRVPEVASLIPVATGAKVATTIPTEFAATVGPMVAASRMTGRLADPNVIEPNVLDEITKLGVSTDPRMQALMASDDDFTKKPPDTDATPDVTEEIASTTFEIDRDVKRAKRRGRITAEEKATILNAGFTPKAAQEAIDNFTEYRRTHSPKDGWQPISVRIKTDKKSGKPKVVMTTKPSSFHQDKKTGKALTDTEDSNARTNEVRRLGRKMVSEFRDIETRAARGDKNASKMLEAAEWYKGVRTRIFDAFGGAANIYGDLNAALSPNTQLAENVVMANSATRRFLRGDFDEKLEKLRIHLDNGGTRDTFPSKDLIKKENGRNYGLNSYNSMIAMLDSFRGLQAGSAPKMRNYGESLLGLSTEPVIDIWAGRTLQRLSGRPRVAPVNDTASAISGTVLTDGKTVGGAYGFGQDVFKQAADEIGLDPNDLQAVMWFKEKELWEKNKWTAQREANIIEMMEDLGGQGAPQRFQGGISVTQESVPGPATQQLGREGLLKNLNDHPQVHAARAVDTQGLYAGDLEKSYDFEWTAGQDYDPSQGVSDVAKVAKENNQYDAFVSRVITGDEVNDNARPGMEIYFKKGKSEYETKELAKIVEEMGQDGFTFITDAKMREGPTEYTGIRLVYTPEIMARWNKDIRPAMLDPEQLDNMKQEAFDQIEDIVNKLSKRDDVLFSKAYHYDTVVMGRENYDDYIINQADSGTTTSQKQTPLSFGESIHDHVRAAISRYEQSENAGSIPVGETSDVSGGQKVLDELSDMGVDPIE
jgi:hypothetical protein